MEKHEGEGGVVVVVVMVVVVWREMQGTGCRGHCFGF